MSKLTNSPTSVFKDSDGRFYITSYNMCNVKRIDNFAGDNPLTYGFDFTPGSGVGYFNAPSEVILDNENRIHIGDIGNSRIVRIDDMIGTNYIEFSDDGTGNQIGSSNGFFMDDDGIYIADGTRIVRIDDMTGINWVEFGTAGTDINQFNGAMDVLIFYEVVE
jgi:hypothetical protein